jgi:hypothetical protein
MFDDFLLSDMQLEVCREFKIRAVREMANDEQEMQFLIGYGIKEFLS